MNAMAPMPSRALLAAIERQRRHLWGLCYRMTGRRSDADDLSQEAMARAIEREPGLAHREGLEGWLFRIATTRRTTRARRSTGSRPSGVTSMTWSTPTPQCRY